MNGIINEEYINDIYNLIKIGYQKVLCNPKDNKQLSELYPDITFTITNYVEEGKIILVNPDEVTKHSIKKPEMKIG